MPAANRDQRHDLAGARCGLEARRRSSTELSNRFTAIVFSGLTATKRRQTWLLKTKNRRANSAVFSMERALHVEAPKCCYKCGNDCRATSSMCQARRDPLTSVDFTTALER